jgi:hypothetical protein
MTGKFLIDMTDPRFLIASNDDVMAFVRRTNPSAHGDVGSVLLELGKQIVGSHAYCPSYRSMAYVVLHTESSRIFAIAFGQRGLAFRLDEGTIAEAIDDGGTLAPEIGSDWVRFPPWGSKDVAAAFEARLRRWSAAAFQNAAAS